MKTTTVQYYLSDHAYSTLIHRAQMGGYVPWGSDRVKGIGIFLSDLALMEFDDTRPALVRERHREQIALNYAPVWTSYRQRRTRLITLTRDAVARYWALAFRFGITRREPYLKGEPSRISPTPSVSYVLEGIGLQWITPHLWPIKETTNAS